ncbi:MAG: hypothetical protein COT17_00425 [Elusimicrobia bacterium CG08_land_8_20_14_0_20_51_18]|nr:MAG: hypothetical protein COT17_00425 [Elusimicrobia bacterium CG08_land_8_20_14_0_20_51_18]
MYKREDRLKALFLQEVTFAIRNKEQLKKHGLLTITDVEILDEGKILRVFFSVFGSEEDKEKTGLMLSALAWEIKQSMKKRLKLRIIPNIVFMPDDTPERAGKIEEIFRKIASEKRDETPGTPENRN